MGGPVRILAFSGSARKESLNRKFLAAAVEAAQAAGCAVTVADLGEYDLPLYNGDLEDRDGMPANASRLVDLIRGHSALLVASPEYNSMFTPLLKNTIDWCSRPDVNPFENKVAAVLSASPGFHGGVRSLQLAQQLLLKLGCHVVPGQCILPHANQAFDDKGKLLEERAQKAVKALVGRMIDLATRLAS